MESWISVLVVEDEDHIRQIIKYNLELEGFKIQEAENGKVALEMLRSMEEKPKVVLSDRMMPEMDGIELLEAIREDYELEKIPVIMLTAKATIGDIEDAFDAKADGYITKPFDPEKLGDMIKEKLKDCIPNRQKHWNKKKEKPKKVKSATRNPENLVG